MLNSDETHHTVLRTTPNKYLIAAFLLCFNLFYGANFSAVNPIMPLIMEDYDVSRGTASLLVALVFMVQAAFMIPGGMLVARAPVKLTFGLGWLIAAAMALAPLADSFSTLVVLRLVYGLAIVVAMPANSIIVMRVFSRRHLPLVNGLNISFFTIGIGLATFITAPISDLIGWQNTLGILGGTLAVGFVAWVLLARLPDSDRTETDTITFSQMWIAIRSKVAILLGLGDGAVLALYVALTTWLPTYYNEVFDMSLNKAGFIVGLVSISGLAGTLLGGFLSTRTGVRRPFFIASGVLAGLSGFGTFALNNEVLIYVSVVTVGFACFFYLPVFLTVPMEMEGIAPRQVAVMWATMFAIGSAVSIVSPITVGLMTDQMGTYIPAFSVWCVFAFGLLVVALLLPETGPGRHRETQPSVEVVPEEVEPG